MEFRVWLESDLDQPWSVDEIKPPPIAYHTTPAFNIEAISSKGLEPRADNPQDEYDPRIYLASTIMEAVSYAKQLRQALVKSKRVKSNWDEDYAIFQVNTSGLPNKFFEEKGLRRRGFYTKEPIPPQNIQFVTMVDHEILLAKNFKAFKDWYFWQTKPKPDFVQSFDPKG